MVRHPPPRAATRTITQLHDTDDHRALILDARLAAADGATS
jgi:hypothetical protein